MNVEEFRAYCLSKEDASEKMPFATQRSPNIQNILCFYVKGKWFCTVNIEVFDHCCLKTGEASDELRARYSGIQPAWHMNKRLWSDVYFQQDVTDEFLKRLIDQSYREVKGREKRKG